MWVVSTVPKVETNLSVTYASVVAIVPAVFAAWGACVPVVIAVAFGHGGPPWFTVISMLTFSRRASFRSKTQYVCVSAFLAGMATANQIFLVHRRLPVPKRCPVFSMIWYHFAQTYAFATSPAPVVQSPSCSRLGVETELCTLICHPQYGMDSRRDNVPTSEHCRIRTSDRRSSMLTLFQRVKRVMSRLQHDHESRRSRRGVK